MPCSGLRVPGLLSVVLSSLFCLIVGACAPRLVLVEHPLAWTISGPSTVKQGAPFRARLHVVIPQGWHLYSTTQPPGGPFTTIIAVDSADRVFGLTGSVGAPDPVIAPDNNFGILTETYVDSVDFSMPLIARSAGRATLTVDVSYETCTDRTCLPPTTDHLTLAINVTPGTTVAATAIVAPPPPPPPPPAAAVSTPASAPSTSPAAATTAVANPGGPAGSTQSLPLFLWLAVVMGAVSLLTPCVFPMIPITVSYFTRSNERSAARPARNALIYAGGIMATFTVLGMAIAVLVGAGGINRFAANPWINLLVTAIFVVFALSLFGVFEIAVPASLLTRIDRVGRSASGETTGLLLMGLTFTLTSFTCTAPFVGTLLVMAARGSWLWPLLGLLVFSGVFALPFFLLALMPGLVARLPRSGQWLGSVKVVMGLIELAMAMKFLSNADMVFRWGVVTRNVVLAVWLVVAVVTALYLLGLVATTTPFSVRGLGRVRPVLAAVMLAIAVYLVRGLDGHRIGELESFVPPAEGIVTAGTMTAPGDLSWIVNSYEDALAQARAQHKSLLVDFTGYTCTNCRWMESNMFPRPAVRDQLARFVRVRLYTDGAGPIYQQQQQFEQDRMGTVALPYYAVFDTSGRVTAQFLGMTRSTDEFVDFLARGKSVTR
jgi:thiol:disulfide interchange protein